MRILKFGSSTLSTSENILKVKKIVEEQKGDVAVIISAFGNLTNLLNSAIELAVVQDKKFMSEIKNINAFVLSIVNDLFGSDKNIQLFDRITSLLKQLAVSLGSIYELKIVSGKIKDKILSYGDYISSLIFYSLLKDAALIDSREIIKTDAVFRKANVNFKLSEKLIKEKFKNINKIAIIPGFIGSNEYSETTTLGRGGSDYTASIIAAALDAKTLEIWTDVDGFMTADPNIVEKAFPIKNLSYAEALELSHFGAKVLYTPTIQPVYKKGIKILIKNVFNPDAEGTIISNSAGECEDKIKGVSSIDKIDLITIQGPGMAGVQGISGRLFSKLAEYKVNIIFITQASSEYSISFAIILDDTETAVNAINEEFYTEIEIKNEIKINVEKELSIVAIVGENMKNTPGISANLFQSLGRNGINVIGIAQGSSELNISVVIKEKSLKKALNVIHEGFFLSPSKEIHLFIVGTGTVGSALLKQLHQQKKKLLKQHHLKINIVGIADIDKMIINSNGIDISTYQDDLKNNGISLNLFKFSDSIIDLNLRNSIFVDCTASKDVSDLYLKLLNSYISVVAANKIACSSEYETYKKLKKTALERKVKFMYETNVGAGLPIINTISNLINSGDKIIGIEAVLSGTLNFVFNELSENVPLSKAIQKAKEQGFSEPDPRIDLSGIDVVRKILILARDAGYTIEQKDVEIKGFLPDDFFKGSTEDFWNKIKTVDADFEKKRKKLEKENKKWRFIASLKNGKASVELKTVDYTHPSYPLVGSNNIILLTTERYKEQPLIIRGYGAGAEVTAAGVFGDIMQVAHI